MKILTILFLFFGLNPAQLTWENYTATPDFESNENVNTYCTFLFENQSWNNYSKKAYFKINYDFLESHSWVKNPENESIENERVVLNLYAAYCKKLRSEIELINAPKDDVDNLITLKVNAVSFECSNQVMDYRNQLLYGETPATTRTQYNAIADSVSTAFSGYTNEIVEVTFY